MKRKLIVLLGLIMLISANAWSFGAAQSNKELDNVIHDSEIYLRDSKKLDSVIKDAEKKLESINKRLHRIETAYKKSNEIEKSLKTVESLLSVAEVVPETRSQAKSLRGKIKSFRSKLSTVNKGLKKAADSAKKVEDIDKKVIVVLKKWQKGLGISNTWVGKITNTASKINNCLYGSDTKSTHKVLGMKAFKSQNSFQCFDSIIAPPSKDIEVVIEKTDKVNKTIADKYNEFNSIIIKLSKDLDYLEKAEKALSDIVNQLDGLVQGLHGLSALMNKKFGFDLGSLHIPLVSGYIGISFSDIIKGVSSIEKAIEDVISGFMYGLLKPFGLGQVVDAIKNAANSALREVMKKLHFDINFHIKEISDIEKKVKEMEDFFKQLADKLSAFKISVDGFKTDFPNLDFSLCAQAQKKCIK